MLSLDSLRRDVEAGLIDTVILTFTDLYGRQMGKRLDAEFFLQGIAAEHGAHACDYLLTVDMEMEPVPGYRLANWERGYGDFHMAPDLSTLRRASWLDRTAMVACDLLHTGTHRPVLQSPRAILRRQVARAAALGYSAMAGSEIEYYIFRNTYRQAAASDFSGLEPAGWYLEDYHILQGTREESLNGTVRRHLACSGVPVECTKGEWGAGQHELNVRFADVLTMADRHTVLKQCLKEVADQLDLSVTFMAKFDAARAGSSCHLHLSLWQDGRNVMAGDESFGTVKASRVFGSFLAGWMEHVPEMMVFYAPTINSYKRYRAASWAPTRLAWSHDNRTASFRVVGQGPGLRIECRIPGADCNPYLAFAASLASGLDGIERRLAPPPTLEGNLYAAESLPSVPMTLRDAIDHFEASPFARRALGEEVVEHYAHFYRTEQQAYDQAVTDWERRRYFERI
jgi:glutamine synthetase